jgi:RNA polymerase sigma factor (sigma-70 family)
MLDELYEFGRKTHPGLWLPAPVFEQGVVVRAKARIQRTGVAASADSLDEVLRSTSGADVYLVLCCDTDIPNAWARFTQAYEPRLRKLAFHLGCRDVDAVCTDLLGDLSGPVKTEYALTRLGTYSGAGTLFAWLGVILRRGLADRARALTRRRPARPQLVPPTPPDPLEGALIDELAGQLGELLHLAWESLDDQERLVLLFKYREGLGQRAIATVMHLSESRISRIVSRAVTRIRTKCLTHLEHEGSGRWQDQGQLWHALLHVVAKHLSEAGPVDRKDPTREARHG